MQPTVQEPVKELSKYVWLCRKLNVHPFFFAPVCTSTLAMGVNLPAHLVVIKSTIQYVNSGFVEYGESQVLQMIGRAGRPQFDTSATAVIMTKNATKVSVATAGNVLAVTSDPLLHLKMKYDALINGSQVIESS